MIPFTVRVPEGRAIIAHCFNGGYEAVLFALSPGGTTEIADRPH